MPSNPSLPPFSGRNADCPKCGAGLGTTWHLICLNNGFPCHRVRPPRHFEHLCRVCPCCGYGRIEATIGAGEATPELSGRHLGLASPGGAER